MSFRPVFFILLFAVMVSCTTSRWIVVDEQAAQSTETETILSEKTIINPVRTPTPGNPVLTFEVVDVIEKEIAQQVVLERGIQQYRPKWSYWAAGLSASVFAGLAANTTLFHSGISDPAVVAFNLSALVLAGFTVAQMEPVGEPILTGEQRMSRSSGFQQLTDSLSRNDELLELPAYVEVQYSGSVIHRIEQMRFINGENSINLGALLIDSGMPVQEEERMDIVVLHKDQSFDFQYRVENLFSPYIEITEPVAVLRNAPLNSELNIVAEVGEGSVFELIENNPELDWYRVRFGGSELFVSRSVAEITWMTDGTVDDTDVFEFAEVRFGAVDVESAVPILKGNNPADRAITFTNTFLEQPEIQRYAERDRRLFQFYMSAAYQMNGSQIANIQIDSTDVWRDQLEDFSATDSTHVLYAYLSGKAHIADDTIYMRTSASDEQPLVSVSHLLEELAEMSPEKFIVLVDLDFSSGSSVNQNNNGTRVNSQVQQQTAARLLRSAPNSVMIFSSRPDQTSSLYAGRGSENKQHRIFIYYWADAIKKRSRTVSDVIRHLENNVDYTSRRLHDRPQEVQAFGNMTINPTE